jgi:hypothetical protein
LVWRISLWYFSKVFAQTARVGKPGFILDGYELHSFGRTGVLPDGNQSAYLHELPFFIALNSGVGVTRRRSNFHRTKLTGWAFSESSASLPMRWMTEHLHWPVCRYFTGTLFICAISVHILHRLLSFTHIHNGFHKVSHAASNVGWRTNLPTHTKDYGIKSLALFIPFPFSLIEDLWLLLIGKNVV